MILEQWFGVPIWVNFIDIDLSKIEKLCYEEMSVSEGRIHSNVGGWQSNNFNMRDSENNFHKLYLEIKNQLQNITNQIDGNYKLEVTNSWININNHNSYNVDHFHRSSTLSGCFYVKAHENCGKICFRNNSLMDHYPTELLRSKNSSLFFDFVTHTAEPGKLIVFPSWLQHNVLPNLSGHDRISISFNTIEYE